MGQLYIDSEADKSVNANPGCKYTDRERERWVFVSIATPGLFRWLLRLGTGFLGDEFSARKDTNTQGCVDVSVLSGNLEKTGKAGYILTKGALKQNGVCLNFI